MNQHATAKPQQSMHLVSTALVGIVCIASLGAAAIGLYSSHGVKADICGMAARQLWGIEATMRNDRRLIPRDIKSVVLKTVGGTQGFMAKHCPAEAIKPPEPETTADPHELLKQLMGSMLE